MQHKLITIMMMFYLSFMGCKGQNNTSMLSNSIPLSSFEEKQKQAIGVQEKSYKNGNLPIFNFRYAAKKATPGVVHIKSSYPMKPYAKEPDFFRDFFGEDFFREYFSPRDNKPQLQMGSASGVIVSNDGYIVTNHHVVEDADNLEVVLHDQRSYKATLIGTDPATDLALIKIDEKNLAFIEFGNSDSVEVGDVVLAVGNPFNLASTVTAGIISAKARNINILNSEGAIEAYLQTDAAVNKGNSGGALVDINGKLIGINAAIATPTGVYAGYSFAVPIDIVKKVINDLMNYKKVMRGVLGVIITDMNGEKAKELGISTTTGVYVDSLQKNGAAMEAGVRKKDVIIKVDNNSVETATQLREIIARHKPNETVTLTLLRDGKEKQIIVTLKAVPEKPELTVSKNDVLKKLGIDIETVSDAERNKLKIAGGVRVKSISKGKIYTTGMRSGFIITKVNGNPIKTIEDFLKELEGDKEGIMLEGIYPGYSGTHFYAFGLK